MEENKNEKFSLCNVVELPKWNFRTNFNLPIDNNAKVKKVLNVHSYLYDIKTTATSGKADITGCVGVKVLYVDVDGVFNTLSDKSTFSESITDTAITSDCRVVVNNIQSSNIVDYDEKYLKITCEFTGNAYCNMNLGLCTIQDDIEGVITKKTTIGAMTNVQMVDTTTSIDLDVNIQDQVAKILLCENKLSVSDVVAMDGYALISGNVVTNMFYEVDSEEVQVKFKSETVPFKTEIEIGLCDKTCAIDIESLLDPNRSTTTTEIGTDGAKIKMTVCAQVTGFVYKEVNIEVCDDIYSVDNEIITSSANRTLYHKLPITCIKTDVNGEVEITSDETNIDEVLGIMGTSASITQYHISDGELIIEGLLGATVLYKDEASDIASIYTEIPFIIKQAVDSDSAVEYGHFAIVPLSARAKIKRGSIIDLDYEIAVCGHIYVKENREILENIKFGKAYDYGDIAFQIYVIKPNEDMWSLCKRIKTSPTELLKTNKDLTEPLKAGDKVVIYR